MIGHIVDNETMVSGSVLLIAISLVVFAFIEFARLVLIYDKNITKKDKDTLNSIITAASGLIIIFIINETFITISNFIEFSLYSILLYALMLIPWVLFLLLRMNKCSYNDAGFIRDAVTIAVIIITGFMPIYLVSYMITNSPDKITNHFHQGIVKKMEYNSSTGGTDIYFTRENDNATYFVKADKKFKDGQIKFINEDKSIEIAFFCVNSKQDPVVKVSDKSIASVCQFKEGKSDQQSRTDAVSGVLQ